MLFNSLDFALIFLPLVFCLHWTICSRSRSLQNALLLAASFLFYSLWDSRFSLLLAASIGLNFSLGKLIDRGTERARRWGMWLAVGTNLMVLGGFKYTNFAINTANSLIPGTSHPFKPLDIIIPVGISFYTFHGISYVMDIYYRRISSHERLLDYALFVAYFPLLVAGPIERATNLLPQLSNRRRLHVDLIKPAISLILWGFLKKVVVADSLGVYVDDVYANFLAISSGHLILASLLFSFQIYADFSGYTDIARGVSKLFGLDLLLNFNFPYFSKSIPEFWSRWHISLSSFLNDYVFKPTALALRDFGKMGIYSSILFTFLVSGVWHGAGWNYVAWGAMHAAFYLPQFMGSRVGIRTLVGKQTNPAGTNFRLLDAAAMLRVFLLVSLTLVIFRSKDLSSAVHYLKHIASWKTGFQLGEILRSGDHYLIFSKGLIGLVLLLMMEFRNFRRSLGVESIIDSNWKIVAILLAIGLLGTFENTTKFIYFQF